MSFGGATLIPGGGDGGQEPTRADLEAIAHGFPEPTGRLRVGPGHVGGARIRSHGLVARLAPIRGQTPRSVLSHAIWLPAVLGSLTVSEDATHNEYETLSAGQFSQPAMGGPSVGRLRTLPLDSLILAYDPRWIVVSGQNPVRLRNSLLGVLRSRRPVHLLMTWHPHAGRWPEVDMNVTLRSAAREIRQQENDTVYVSMQVSEWRDPSVARGGSRPAGGNSGRHRSKTLPARHRLTAQDTLHSLAMAYYGSYSGWREIRAANGIPVRFGQSTPLVRLGGRFRVGATIRIPKLPAATPVSGAGGV